MDCAICSSQSSRQPDLHCPACARSALYPRRVALARALVERQDLSRDVEDLVSAAHLTRTNRRRAQFHTESRQDARAASDRVGETLAQLERTQTHIEQLKYECTKLKHEMRRLGERIKIRREKAEITKGIVESAKVQLSTKLKETHGSIKTNNELLSKHDAIYKNTVSHRAELCREAARVARFRRKHSTTSDGKTRYDFEIFGAQLPELMDLNRASPQEVSLSLSHFCRLISLICRYLQLRLPAEIRLPSADNSHPVIFTPASSYNMYRGNAKYLTPGGKNDSKQRHLVPASSMPNPRPLNLDRSLSLLIKEDPKLYALFVEGVALLAWDVAWLCRTQGIPVASNEWQDMCHIGQNLWLLTTGDPLRHAEPISIDRMKRYQDDEIFKTIRINLSDRMTPFVGRYSQGTAFSSKFFLDHRSCDLPTYCGISEQCWVFASSTRFVDPFKNHLHADIYGQEWELLEEHEYNGGADDPVVIGPPEEQGARGRSGWTKLRPRPL